MFRNERLSSSCSKSCLQQFLSGDCQEDVSCGAPVAAAECPLRYLQTRISICFWHSDRSVHKHPQIKPQDNPAADGFVATETTSGGSALQGGTEFCIPQVSPSLNLSLTEHSKRNIQSFFFFRHTSCGFQMKWQKSSAFATQQINRVQSTVFSGDKGITEDATIPQSITCNVVPGC